MHLITMRKSNLKIGLISFLLCSFTIVLFSQTKVNPEDSLLLLTKSPIDTVRLNALKKLSWNLRTINPLQAFEYAFDALTLAEKLERGEDQATINNYIGVIAIKIKSFDKAKAHVLKAYQIADSLNIINQKAYAKNNLGEIFHLSDQPDLALQPLNDAIELFKSINDSTGLAYAYNQMGMTLLRLGKFEEAYKYHTLAYNIRSRLNLAVYATSALQNMAIDLIEAGKYAEARKNLELMDLTQLKSIPYFTIPYRLILIGKTYQGEKNFQSAIHFFKTALEYADSASFFVEKRDAAKMLSELYDSEKDFQQALKYYNIYKVADDSVKSADLIDEYKALEMKRIFEAQYKYLEYKMQQDIDNQKLKLYWSRVLTYSIGAFSLILLILIIVLVRNFKTIARNNKLLQEQKEAIGNKNNELQAQNIQISEQKEAILKQRDELAVANATKDKFFSIIAHDLRGPVGNLTAFINLILESYHDKINMNLMDIFGVLNTSAQQTYTLLENLLTWSQSQSGSIQFNPVINSLYSITDNNIELLKQKADEKKIAIENLVPSDLITHFDTHMIDTVLRNLISNALKFTSENGKITIKGALKEQFIEVTVADNGIGMTQNELNQLFRIDVKHKTKEGTNGEKGSGLGLILCKEFIDKHGGKISVKSEPGKGSEISITLPYYTEKNKKIEGSGEIKS